MAADTRPYKSKEQDGQGNELIIRDQQLVEQASQTTMASGEYFEIVDVDGRMAKIPKANMVDIVREALGSLLNGLSDQTTVTKVPSLNGNTLGASTVATLASVLGAIVGRGVINSLGSQQDNTACMVVGANDLPSGMGIHGFSLLFNSKYPYSGNNYRCVQLYFTSTNCYFRMADYSDSSQKDWNSWRTFSMES